MRTLVTTCFVSLLAIPALAQGPANDFVLTAQTLTSGATVTGTTVGAADNLPGAVACQPDTLPAPEVWYAITATDSRLTYSVVGSQPLDVFVFDGPLDSAATLISAGCGATLLTDTLEGMSNGHTYYLAVASPAALASSFTITATCSATSLAAAQDCNQAKLIHHQRVFFQAALTTGLGADPNEATPTNSCWGSGGERQPKWYRFTAGATERLEFSVLPNNLTDDYDWAVWDVTTDPTGCTTKGNAIACNWSGARGATGQSLTPTAEPGYQGGDQFDNSMTALTGANAPVTVNAGHVYALLVDNFSTSSLGYKLTFGGTRPSGSQLPRGSAPGASAVFGATTVSARMRAFAPMSAYDTAATVTFAWSFGDGATSTLQEPTHTFARDGYYYVTLRVTDAFGLTTTYGRRLTIGTPTGLSAATAADGLVLAPNPARQQVRLTLDPALGARTVLLFDQLGRLVRSQALTAGQTAATLPLTDLRPGIYTVRAGQSSRRLVVE